MECPRCRNELKRIDEGLFGDIETHVCRTCDGTFYPPGSLDRLDDVLTVNIEAIELEPRPEPALRCPVGHAARHGIYRGAADGTLQFCEPVEDRNIRVAVCAECSGFWLEGDALDHLRAIGLELSSAQNASLNATATAAKVLADKKKR